MTSGCSIFATEYAFWNFEPCLSVKNSPERKWVTAHDFIRRHNSKLDFLDFADRSRGMGELVAEHDSIKRQQAA